MFRAAGVVVFIVAAIRRHRGQREQASAERELVGTVAVRQEAVMANAMEAIRQDVEEEAAHKLGDLDAHDFALVTAALPGLFPSEADVGLVDI